MAKSQQCSYQLQTSHNKNYAEAFMNLAIPSYGAAKSGDCHRSSRLAGSASILLLGMVRQSRIKAPASPVFERIHRQNRKVRIPRLHMLRRNRTEAPVLLQP